jgi:hypothetical protein
MICDRGDKTSSNVKPKKYPPSTLFSFSNFSISGASWNMTSNCPGTASPGNPYAGVWAEAREIKPIKNRPEYRNTRYDLFIMKIKIQINSRYVNICTKIRDTKKPRPKWTGLF